MTITHNDDVVITGDLEVQGSSGISTDKLVVDDLMWLQTQPILFGNTIINGGFWSQDNSTEDNWSMHVKTDYGELDSDENLELYKAVNSATIAPALQFYKARGYPSWVSPQDGDHIAHIDFVADNDAASYAFYATIDVCAVDVSSGSEDGQLSFATMTAGSLSNGMVIKSNKVGVGTDSPDYKLHVLDAGYAALGVQTTAGNAELRLIDQAGDNASYIWFRQAASGATVNHNITSFGQSHATGAGLFVFQNRVEAKDIRFDTTPSGGSVREAMRVTSAGYLYLDALATKSLRFIDAGTVAATEDGWIQVQVGGTTHYIHTFTGK